MASNFENEQETRTMNSTAAKHDDIARRAYEIREVSGRPEGMDSEHWNQAERELMNGSMTETRAPFTSDFASTGQSFEAGPPQGGTRPAPLTHQWAHIHKALDRHEEGSSPRKHTRRITPFPFATRAQGLSSTNTV